MTRALTAVNCHDVTQLIPLVDTVPPVTGKCGRPRRRPRLLNVDRAYDYHHNPMDLWARGIAPGIPLHGTPNGSGLGKRRWGLERTLNWRQRLRQLRSRFEHRTDIQDVLLFLGGDMICYWRV